MDENITLIPVSLIVATSNRTDVLSRMLASLSLQHYIPAQIIFIDGSNDGTTQQLIELTHLFGAAIFYERAIILGAAAQRNQGIQKADYQVIAFADDDILFEVNCIKSLYEAVLMDSNIGGVNAMVVNQKYHPPGKISAFMYWLMNGSKLDSYAGKCIGPAWNLLPSDDLSLPDINETEWLNTTCTFYRRQALPGIPFPDIFKGYSLMEDLALSLEVGKKWKLYNVKTARIFHDSQIGLHKDNVDQITKMEIVNRYFIMTKIMNRKAVKFKFKFLIFQLFQIITSGKFLNAKYWKGKIQGFNQIIFSDL
jgi:GT2 family glycosyltransferase